MRHSIMAASDEDLAGLRAFAVAVENVFGFASDIEGFRRLALHAIGELEAVDAGVEGRIGAALVEVPLVQGGQSI